MLESKIQAAFIKKLKASGAYYVKIISASTSGHPDILALANGRLHAYEIKSKSGTMSEMQKYRRGQILACGGDYTIIREVQNADTIRKI
jgi:Holliday junction resolvase